MDFCDTLAKILRTAKLEQRKNRFKYGELFCLNYYGEVKEKDRTYYGECIYNGLVDVLCDDEKIVGVLRYNLFLQSISLWVFRNRRWMTQLVANV